MSINSTQIRDGFGREFRVMRGKAPILKNAGLIPIQYWLTNRHFFEKLEKYLGPTLGIYQDTSKVFWDRLTRLYDLVARKGLKDERLLQQV